MLAAAAALLVAGVATPAVSFADNASGCDFASNGTTQSCLGPLSGSTFAGGDGNLLASPTAFGTTDWQNVGGLHTGVDLASGSGDNAFGNGTKEDDPNVTVVSGSIPPNKSDLTRFYEASEFANGSNFLYLAWERTNNLGSANMDFEINQKAQPDLTTPGAKTLNRTAGDLLVTFDFTNGGGRPTLGLLKWVTTGPTSQCFSSSSLPCWGNHVNLNSGDSEGAVNNLGPVTDPFQSGTNNVGALRFGETAINLTAAGVFPQGTCEAFGSAFLKSRSSASFPAEVKDFVAPVPVSISNCGTIIIHKVTENGDGTFGYTTTGGLTPATFNLSNGQTRTYGPGTVLPGDYSVTESTLPSGWTLKSLVCTATGSGTSKTINGATVSLTMAPEGTVECTYTNHTNAGPSIATTLSEGTGSVGDQVHDSATLTGATATAGGTVTYTVYSDNTCTSKVAGAGTVNVTNGTVPDSNAITFNNAGTFYWQAVYSGDGNNLGATSPCTSEQLVISPNKPSIATTLSEGTGSIGDQVHDSATLTGASATAGGTVTYTVYTDSNCSLGAVDAGTKTVTNGTVPDSNAITFNNAGTFYWQAVYSGDGNNLGATSPCTSEQLVISPNKPSIATAQNLIPNDAATISGVTSNAGGTVTFDLFSPSDATCSGTPALTQQVTVNGNGTYKTTNSTFIASATGEWRWQVIYSGDSNNNGVTSACGVENFTITNG